MGIEDDQIPKDYLVTPEVGNATGVMVLHSGRGLTDFTRSLCQRLARENFVALAPDMFHGETPTTTEESQAVKNQIDESALLHRLEDSSEFLRLHDAVNSRPIGIIGIGFGSEIALRLAAKLGDECGALVVFYGHTPVDLSRIQAPILGHYAQIDHEIPESKVNELRDQCREFGVQHDLFMYSGTEPSFFETDDTARYDPESAKLAWERTAQFLRIHVG